MAKVTFVEFSGTEHVIDADDGMSAMEAAINNEIPGIVADCRGACACATCHVFVDPQWLSLTGEVSELEDAMLDLAEDRAENSRLSCQIVVSGVLDGLVLRMPETQG